MPNWQLPRRCKNNVIEVFLLCRKFDKSFNSISLTVALNARSIASNTFHIYISDKKVNFIYHIGFCKYSNLINCPPIGSLCRGSIVLKLYPISRHILTSCDQHIRYLVPMPGNTVLELFNANVPRC